SGKTLGLAGSPGARRIEDCGSVGPERATRQRITGEVASLDRDARLADGGVSERGRGSLVAFDGVDGAVAGQGKRKAAEPGEEVEHGTAGADTAKNLFDEHHLGRLACLQKGAGRTGDRDPR